jgi:hypothetical protein
MPANLTQAQWRWTGWSGAPGYTSFYYETVEDATLASNQTAERTFFQALVGWLPNTVTLSPPSSWRKVDKATGNLFEITPVVAPVTPVVGTGTQVFAAPAGVSVNWLTSEPAISRTMTGRTYLVPLSSYAYQLDGTVVGLAMTEIQAAANAFVASTTLTHVVWHRPVAHAGGKTGHVTAARINDRISILRSRRS